MYSDAISVKELARILNGLIEEGRGNAIVHFSYDYGDYVHTLVAPPVTDVCKSVDIVYSDYHGEYKILGLESDAEDYDNVEPNVVILSCGEIL